uniref:27 kDa hemolymph protein n=1 Tax=Cacopsylla melanoneura TaxID=428564 RepID=A0A8D8LPB4_9HEMI
MKYLILTAVLSACLVCTLGQEPTLEDLVKDGAAKVPDIIGNLDLPPGIPPINASAIPSIDEADQIIKDKCDKNGGNSSYDNFQMAKEEVNICVSNLVSFTELKIEIEGAKPTGDLDRVFSKYCRKSPILKQCVTNFTSALEPCLEPKEKQTKIVFQNVSESLLDFICHKEGDRIALFIAEGGPECISDKKEAIQHCMNITLSKFIPKDTTLNADNIPVFKLEKDECTAIKDMHLCVVRELEKCRETTPSNIVDALMKFMMQQTPCNQFGLYPKRSGSSTLVSTSLMIVMTTMVSLLWR